MRYNVFILKENSDLRGKLVAIESSKDIGFEIKRIFYIYGNTNSLPRAGHANIQAEQVIICLKGSCQIFVDDGKNQDFFLLNAPNKAIHIEANVWLQLDEFSEDCILLVLASDHYNPSLQVANYKEFKEKVR